MEMLFTAHEKGTKDSWAQGHELTKSEESFIT